MVNLPVRVEYRLERDSEVLKVKLSVDNQAKDHWQRANFPTGIDTDVSWADSHFDIIARDVSVPDPTGWVEQPQKTHPLRTFVVWMKAKLRILQQTAIFSLMNQPLKRLLH